MCLDATEKSTKAFLAKLKKQNKNWFYIYKPVVRRTRFTLRTLFFGVNIPKEGEFSSNRQNKEINCEIDGDVGEKNVRWHISKGIHGFLNRRQAKTYMEHNGFTAWGVYYCDILRCKARAEDIVAIGFFADCPSCALMKVEVCPDSYKKILAKKNKKR